MLWVISTINLSAQKIRVEYNHTPLNQILTEIRDKYSINLSFDNKELAKYRVTVNKYFDTPDKAFDFLLKNLPIAYEKHSNVFLFYKNEKLIVKVKSYRLSGKIYDKKNKESLPYTHLIINEYGVVTDEHGNFNFESKKDSVFQIKVLHLGYNQLDTIVVQVLNIKLGLKTSIVSLNEVTVKGESVIFSEQTGTKAGLMRINHKVARLIPGNGDNSVFNILRLQPGILAAGEQSNEMIIWGSYEGQSLVNFDGVTVFGLKNFNDNISTVNPYIIKDIRVHKGGFDATFGERVGAIVDITGIEGNNKKAGFNLNINNMTMNLMAQIPLSDKISMVGAFRQTYYNLYSPEDLNFSQSSNSHMPSNSIAVSPDYIFRDGNIKFTGETNSGDSYGLAMFWGQDNFSYMVDQEHSGGTVSQVLNEKSLRYGSSFLYHRLLKGLGSIELNIDYSGLKKERYDDQSNTGMDMNMGHNSHDKNQIINNDVTELKSNLIGEFRLFRNHELKLGGGIINNSTYLLEDSSTITLTDKLSTGNRIYSFLQDRISVSKYLYLTIGIRANYVFDLKKTFLQPRFNISIIPNETLRFNASWGKYNQFIVLNPIIDQYNNYTYQWMISGFNQIPILESQHFTFGGVFHKNGFSISIEGYYKETEGISRYLQNETGSVLHIGTGKTKGLDFFVKQEYNGHTVWISYSLAQSLEWFPFFQSSEYQSALQDQRHEVKLTGIINLKPFYVSGSYVYGSGFIPSKIEDISILDQYPYSRIDLAVVYAFSIKKLRMETGVSVLNLLNKENIKFNNITQVPTTTENTVNIYSKTVPFTPSVFLNIAF